MLKTLSAYIKEYKWASLMTPVFMILEVLAEILIPLLMASLIDKGIVKGDMNHILYIGALMIVVAVFGLVTGMLGGKYGAKAATGFAKNLRQGMFEKIQTYSFSNIDKFNTASLITRLTTDVTNVQNAYQMILRMCMRAPASLLLAMTASFFVSPKVAMVYLIAVTLLGFVLAFIISHATKYFRMGFPKYDELNASVQENVSAIRVVKAYVREDKEIEKFKTASNNIYKIFIKAEKMISYNNPAMSLTVYACILIISWIGSHMIVGGSLSVGDLTSLLGYCMMILMNLMMLSMVFVMVSMSVASAKRIAEVLEENSNLTNPENPVMDVEDGSITFENVNFSYYTTGEKPVLKDINLSIKSGETIGIIGGTGSAKTSLVNLISRLYDTSSGVVTVGGRNVKEYDLDNLRKQVAVVLQKNVLFSGTVLDNLRWGDENATEEECIRACQLACADEFIERMPDKYNTMIEQGGSNVSGGQKQRLCIARALLRKPKILILDDSTSAVDTATDAKIRRAFKEEIPGTTKIIIAQRISSVEHCDRIIVMDQGEINAFDTPDNLFENNEIYREVYDSQNAGQEIVEQEGMNNGGR